MMASVVWMERVYHQSKSGQKHLAFQDGILLCDALTSPQLLPEFHLNRVTNVGEHPSLTPSLS